MKVTIIIPSYNPTKKLIKLVNELQKNFNDIIIVDDGSTNETKKIYEELLNVKIIYHDINKGKGEALKTAIKNLKDTDAFITVDADLQHSPKDILKIKEELLNNDIILGTRNFNKKNVPFTSKLGNKFSSLVFKIKTGITLKDTQTGLRGISTKYKDLCLNTSGSRYEYEMNFLYNIAKNKIDFRCIDIDTIYEDNNKGSHFHAIRDSLLIHKWLLPFIIILLIIIIILFKCLTKK